MKKIFSILVFTIILLSGCSESFLDRQPEDTLAPGVFFKSPADIKTGVVAIYRPLKSIFSYTTLPNILELMSDDGNRDHVYIAWHTFIKDNTFSSSDLWTNFYKMIVNANNIIDIIDKYTPKNDAEVVTINAYRGEACFLRAFAYFNLVRLYGDVPMVVKRFDDPGTAFGIGRTSVNDIFTKVVIPDLEYAFANCYKKGDAAISSEGARATKGAALTILGEVFLTMHDNASAAATLKKLIVDKEAGNYALLLDYSKIWLPANKYNTESIFEINFNVAAGFPSYHFRNMSNENGFYRGLSTCSGYLLGCKDLMNEFVAYQEWSRYKVSVDSGFNPRMSYLAPIPLKLMPNLSEASKFDITGTDYNYMITRYADALLMYAEALMPTDPGTALTYVNQVRARVNMAPIAASALNIDRILHERRMELAFEGHRYFDLVRTGKAIEYISRALRSNVDYEFRVFRSDDIPEYQLILPIPVTEIEKDQTLTQNPGY